MPEPERPEPGGWWESWSVAAVAILIGVVAFTVLIVALLASMLGD